MTRRPARTRGPNVPPRSVRAVLDLGEAGRKGLPVAFFDPRVVEDLVARGYAVVGGRRPAVTLTAHGKRYLPTLSRAKVAPEDRIDWATVPLGLLPDVTLGKHYQVTDGTIAYQRKLAGIPAYVPKAPTILPADNPPPPLLADGNIDWDRVEALGLARDGALAQALGKSRNTVQEQRTKREIAPCPVRRMSAPATVAVALAPIPADRPVRLTVLPA